MLCALGNLRLMQFWFFEFDPNSEHVLRRTFYVYKLFRLFHAFSSKKQPRDQEEDSEGRRRRHPGQGPHHGQVPQGALRTPQQGLPSPHEVLNQTTLDL